MRVEVRPRIFVIKDDTAHGPCETWKDEWFGGSMFMAKVGTKDLGSGICQNAAVYLAGRPDFDDCVFNAPMYLYTPERRAIRFPDVMKIAGVSPLAT